MKAKGVFMSIVFSTLSQNGIVQKDLTRLKMLLTEIEVSVRSHTAPNDSGLPASVSIKRSQTFGFFVRNYT